MTTNNARRDRLAQRYMGSLLSTTLVPITVRALKLNLRDVDDVLEKMQEVAYRAADLMLAKSQASEGDSHPMTTSSEGGEHQ